MQIELRPLASIKPYENNPRHNDEAIAAVAKSLHEFGWQQPLVIDADGVIVVGHTRWKAAQQLGLETVPVHVATDLTLEQTRAYRIADNQTASIATWDFDLLPLELVALKDVDFDLGLLGFDAHRLRADRPPNVFDGARQREHRVADDQAVGQLFAYPPVAPK